MVSTRQSISALSCAPFLDSCVCESEWWGQRRLFDQGAKERPPCTREYDHRGHPSNAALQRSARCPHLSFAACAFSWLSCSYSLSHMAARCVVALLSRALVVLFVTLPLLCRARDVLTPGRPLRDGETLVSAGSVFELGFFSPDSTSKRYVGIWYYNFSIDTVLWVANRRNPVIGSSGSLAINATDGNLVLLDAAKNVLWSSNASMPSGKSSAQLMDTGNLVINVSGSTAWQSFDNPADTYMPGMKVGLDLRTGVNQMITSWASEVDPAPGNFSMGMDPSESTQIFIWEGNKPRWRSGRWNGQVFIGIQGMVPQYVYGFKLSNFVQEQKMYFYYNAFNSSHRYVLTWDGIVKHMIWRKDTNEWFQYWAQPLTDCEVYNQCGKYASCRDGAAPICSCLRGFVPVSNEEWKNGNWSSGCRRRTALDCGTANNSNSSSSSSSSSGWGGGDRFLRLQGVKLPDLSDWNIDIVDINGCRDSCLRNCTCTAYAFVSGIGCLIWGVDLVDIHMFSSDGNDLYLRLSNSELGDHKTVKVFIIVIAVVIPILLLACTFVFWKCRRRIKYIFRKPVNEEQALVHSSRFPEVVVPNGSTSTRTPEENNEEKFEELQLWSFDSVLNATKEFSDSYLIGGGGFGPVYKGVLPDGQEIAVKRLARSSGQGLEEFKNEVILISKLQHRNLVKLLGCCIQMEEKILIYEFMPNGSLDAFIFDPMKKGLLDWSTRHNIIEGTARGLLYLHRDSRLRIVHRDLKASNILLDEEMNPKISDFGMARIFGNDDNEANTQRVVGTYGYMSPEYAMQGLFSVKSDVYSFGVLVLEIVSGNRNSTFRHPELTLNLTSLAWKLWKEDRLMEYIDPVLLKSCQKSQLVRCINLALLCLQDHPNDRPTMAAVIAMLETESASNSLPRQPTFTTDRSYTETDSTSIDLNLMSANTSVSTIIGR